jgi:hypothetical protein
MAWPSAMVTHNVPIEVQELNEIIKRVTQRNAIKFYWFFSR